MNNAAATLAYEKIRFTLADFCHLTDTGDYDGWAELFTEDGRLIGLGQEHAGRAALRAFIEIDQPPELRGMHLTTDSAITLSDDTARVRSNFIFVAAGQASGVVVTGGRYHDILVPCGDAWLFRQREVELTLPIAGVPWGSAAKAA